MEPIGALDMRQRKSTRRLMDERMSDPSLVRHRILNAVAEPADNLWFMYYNERDVEARLFVSGTDGGQLFVSRATGELYALLGIWEQVRWLVES